MSDAPSHDPADSEDRANDGRRSRSLVPINECDVGEMVGERRRTLEGDVGEGFPASSIVREDSFPRGSSSERAYINPSRLSILSCVRCRTRPNAALNAAASSSLLAYAPSRLPEPPPDIIFLTFFFVRGIHPIGEILP
jgi:hypothetical protein